MTKPEQAVLKTSSEGIALIAAAAFLALTVTIYIPAEIYFSNLDSFTAGFASLAGISFLATVLFVGVAATAAMTLPPHALRMTVAGVAALAIFSFIVGSILTPMTVDLGLIDGGGLRLAIHPAYFALDIALLGGLASLIFFQFSKLRDFLVNMFVMGALFMAAFAGYSAITQPPKAAPAEEGENAFDAQAFFTLSKRENIVLILLDSFDSRFLELLLAENPSLEETLDGFTGFHDTASVSPTTTGAMPAIHSGRMIDFDRPLGESYDALVGEQSFLTAASENAEVMLLNPQRDLCPKGVECGVTADLGRTSSTSILDQWRVLTSISVFRSAPYVAKPALYAAPEWFVALSSSSEDADALPIFAENLSAGDLAPQVRFLHLLHTHTPYNRDFDCTEIPPRDSSPSVALNTVRCAMNGVADFLAALKQAGIYDQTKIIIFADHGAVAFDADTVSTLSLDRIDVSGDGAFLAPRLKNPALKAEANVTPRSSHPLLLVKPRNARGRLAHNYDNAASLLDIGATACAGSEICTAAEGFNAFEAPPASERIRPYYAYELREFQSTFGSGIPVSEVAKKLTINGALASSTPDIDYDEVMQFDFSRDGAMPGFGFAERWGRWSAEERAHFNLCFDARPKAETEIVLKARAYLTGQSKRQRVKATLNGRPVLDRTYSYANPDDRDVIEWRFALQPGDIDNKGCVAIDFEAPDAASPPANWREAGRRRLGFGLISMQLEPGPDAQAQ